MSKEIKYLKGDATCPIGDGKKVIVHICNNKGAWGAGFVLAISNKWKNPEKYYRASFNTSTPPQLGDIQICETDDEHIQVINMIAQDGFVSFNKPVAVFVKHLHKCLKEVSEIATVDKASVHMPRIGCGIGGGDWAEIERIIKDTLCKSDIDVFVYDFE